MNNSQNAFSRFGAWIMSHKTRAAIVAILVIGIGWFGYAKTHAATAASRYVLTTVETGTIISTISGSGQVSPTDQITLNPKASGQITRVLVQDGQSVTAGQAIAYIDSTDEYDAVQTAKANLQSSELSLQKLQEAPDQLSVTQDSDAVSKAQESQTSAQTDLAKTYADAHDDIDATFLDLPTIESDMKDVVLGTTASKGSQWNVDYYQDAIQAWDANAKSYRDDAYASYESQLTSYDAALPDYQATSKDSSNGQISSMLSEAHATAQAVANALNSENSFLQLYQNDIKNQNQNVNPVSTTQLSTLNSDISKMNAHVSALLADQNQITSDTQSIADAGRSIDESQQSLQKLQSGPDTLDVQSSQLDIRQKQQALQQAEDDLSDYTITAPIAGTIADLNAHVGDTVGNSTAAATLITAQQVAELSLNEVDAAKVMTGEKATLTFDAIPDLTLTGTVASVSPLGTVSQGVVSYDVKITFDTQDSRVKAGMSVSADIQTAVHQDVLTVPSSAVKTSNGSSYVLAFQPAISGAEASSTTGVISKAPPTQIPVTIGITDDTNTEIESGLTAGEQIVKSTVSASSAKSTAASATSRSGFGGGAPGAGGAGGGSIRL